MSEPAATSRRAFLTGLFTEPKKLMGNTALSAVADIREQTDVVLWAITGDQPDNLFVAGDEGVVFHYDGEQWQQEVLGSKLNVHSLCMSGDKVFSVGWMGRICVREAGQWTPTQGGQNDGETINLPLFEIEAAADETLWAVGDQGRVCQYKEGQWLEHDIGTQANLRSVLPMPDGRILVGGLGGTVVEYAEGQWKNIETQTGCPIVSMAQLDDEAVIAVGGEYDLTKNTFAGRIFIYADNSWTQVSIDYPLPRLRRVRREGNNLLITGDNGTAFRWSNDKVTLLPTRLRYDLHDVITFDDGQTIICGDSGTLLQETDSAEVNEPREQESTGRWKVLSNHETNKTLRALWAINKNHIIAAGESGTVVHYENDTITVRETPGRQRIHALWGSSEKNVYAVCDSATILHFNGEEWNLAHRGNVDTALLAITGFGPHDIFVVGDNGYALRYDGLMWRQIETGLKQELYGLWGQDSQHLLAVGGGGTVLRWTGERWKTFSAGTDYDLYAVHGTSLNKLFLAGLAGTLIRFEDNAWRREFSGVRSDLHSVTHNDQAFYAVGSNGTILRNADDVWELEDANITNTLQTVMNHEGVIYAAGSDGVLLARSLG